MEKTKFQDPNEEAPLPPPKFIDLQSGFFEFRRRGMHDHTPTRVVRAVERGFFAGAQAMLVLLQERSNAIEIEGKTFEELESLQRAVFETLNKECVDFFRAAAAAAEARGK